MRGRSKGWERGKRPGERREAEAEGGGGAEAEGKTVGRSQLIHSSLGKADPRSRKTGITSAAASAAASTSAS